MVFGICFSLVLFSFSSHFNLDFSPEKLLTDFERLDRTGVVVQKKKQNKTTQILILTKPLYPVVYSFYTQLSVPNELEDKMGCIPIRWVFQDIFALLICSLLKCYKLVSC